MTCSYDGRLIACPKGIEPCCSGMHALIITGQVYLGKVTAKGMPTIHHPKLRTGDKAGMTIECCPCCGAGAETMDANGMPSGSRRVTIRLSAGELAAIDRVAELEGISRSEVVRRAIAAYIESEKEVNQ